MFRVVGCELTEKGMVTFLSVIDETDGVVETVTVMEALSYMEQGVEIKGISKRDERVFVEYTISCNPVVYELEKDENGYKRVITEAKVEEEPVVEQTKSVNKVELVEEVKETSAKSASASVKTQKEAESKTKELAKTTDKPKTRARRLNPLHVSKLIAERVLLIVRDTETGKTEEFDFSTTKTSLKSEILNGLEFTIEACSDDFLYFVGKDVKVSLPSTVVANYSLKDTMLFAVDAILSVRDLDGNKTSLFDKCTGKGTHNIHVFAPFSEELGLSGQRYELLFTYKKL